MSVGFTLRQIKIEQFAMFPEYLNSNQEAQVSDSFQFLLNPEIRQVGVNASFNFKQNEFVIMRIGVSCHFGIDNNVWNSFLEGNRVRLPLDFSTNLFAITTGTTRGVLASKTEHTHFSKFILPLLNLKEVIETDVIFSLD